jgi:hypothetical protein
MESKRSVLKVWRRSLKLDEIAEILHCPLIPLRQAQGNAQPLLPGLGEAIVFISAQPAHCLPPKIVPRLQVDRHFIDILRQILITLNTLDLLPTELNALLASVQTVLAAQPILLIIDNIETITDQDRLLAFLQELPATVTTILTSRTKLGLGTLISLSGLDHRHSSQPIEHIATKKN